MNSSKAKQLYLQDRSFGLDVLQLIILRLMENVKLAREAPGGGANDGFAARA